MAEISQAEIEKIVKQVIGSLEQAGASAPAASYSSTEYQGRKLIGIFSDMNEAIEAAGEGYRAVRAMSVENREKIITAIRELTRREAAVMAEMGVAETGMGKVEHKRLKHLLVADNPRHRGYRQRSQDRRQRSDLGGNGALWGGRRDHAQHQSQ